MISLRDTKIPSVNHYWKPKKGGGLFVSREGRDFKDLLCIYARKAKVKMIKGDVAIKIVWYRKDKRRADLDNILKVIFDGLSGVGYEDDKQIVEIEAQKIYADFEGVDIELKEVI